MAVIVNGKKYSGNNVSIINDKVYIDGKLMTDDESSKSTKIEITIEAGTTINKIEVDGDLEVKGSISGDVSAQGSVKCNDIGGNDSSGGSITCDDIGGNANAGGSVKCDDISGNVNAGGSIHCKNMKGNISM